MLPFTSGFIIGIIILSLLVNFLFKYHKKITFTIYDLDLYEYYKFTPKYNDSINNYYININSFDIIMNATLYRAILYTKIGIYFYYLFFLILSYLYFNYIFFLWKFIIV